MSGNGIEHHTVVMSLKLNPYILPLMYKHLLVIPTFIELSGNDRKKFNYVLCISFVRISPTPRLQIAHARIAKVISGNAVLNASLPPTAPTAPAPSSRLASSRLPAHTASWYWHAHSRIPTRAQPPFSCPDSVAFTHPLAFSSFL